MWEQSCYEKKRFALLNLTWEDSGHLFYVFILFCIFVDSVKTLYGQYTSVVKIPKYSYIRGSSLQVPQRGAVFLFSTK